MVEINIKEKLRIIVLGKNYSTALGVIRSLGKAGYLIDLFYVTGVRGGSKIAAASTYISKCIEQYGRNDEEIIDKLLTSYSESEERCVLFPTDDYTSSLIDRYRNRLKKRFLMPYINEGGEGSITELMNKETQVVCAAKFGLDVAKSWTISLNNDTEINNSIPYPCFCKPLISAKGFKSEICVCNSKEELLLKLKLLKERKSERSVLVQELLNIEEEFSISGVCLGEEVILPALLKKICIAEYEKGVTLMGKVSGFEELGVTNQAAAGVISSLERMLSSFNYFGMIDIELIRCNGKIYFNELNFRSSGVSYAITKAGINLPALLVRAITEQVDFTLDIKDSDIRVGLTFLYDKAAWEDYIYRKISKTDFERYQAEADFTMLNDERDTEPEKIFLHEMAKRKRRVDLEKIIPITKVKVIIKQIIRYHNL